MSHPFFVKILSYSHFPLKQVERKETIAPAQTCTTTVRPNASGTTQAEPRRHRPGRNTPPQPSQTPLNVAHLTWVSCCSSTGKLLIYFLILPIFVSVSLPKLFCQFSLIFTHFPPLPRSPYKNHFDGCIQIISFARIFQSPISAHSCSSYS
jgi:hypothetical protein